MVRMLTIKQCADRLQVCERTVRGMIAKKKFCQHIRIGVQMRFPEDDFEEWARNCEDEKIKYERKQTKRTMNKINKILGETR